MEAKGDSDLFILWDENDDVLLEALIEAENRMEDDSYDAQLVEVLESLEKSATSGLENENKNIYGEKAIEVVGSIGEISATGQYGCGSGVGSSVVGLKNKKNNSDLGEIFKKMRMDVPKSKEGASIAASSSKSVGSSFIKYVVCFYSMLHCIHLFCFSVTRFIVTVVTLHSRKDML